MKARIKAPEGTKTIELREDVFSVCTFSGELMNDNLEVIGELDDYTGEPWYYDER